MLNHTIAIGARTAMIRHKHLKLENCRKIPIRLS